MKESKEEKAFMKANDNWYIAMENLEKQLAPLGAIEGMHIPSLIQAINGLAFADIMVRETMKEQKEEDESK